ncbi:MAG: HNH endonuclease signature motif containing protein [Candidatus Aenigmatarchaeota archaeon]
MDCQYTNRVVSSEETKILPYYNNGSKIEPVIVTISTIGDGWQQPLTIFNPNNVHVSVSLVAKTETKLGFACLDTGNNQYSLYDFGNSTILSKGSVSVPVAGTAGPRCGEYRFTNDYTVTFLSSLGVRLEATKIYNYTDACKICPNGIVCQNNDTKCYGDSQCGSGICNIAGVCGNTKIVACSNGLKNCNNASCLEPSIKEKGQSYSCSWECKSGVGENGVCSMNLSDTLLFLALIILVLGVGTFLLWISYKKWKTKESKKEIERLTKRIDELNDELNKISKKRDKTQEEIAKTKKLKKELEKHQQDLKAYREKSYNNKQGAPVRVNENGYEVFADTGVLFHRWYFERLHGRKIKPGYEIHHKDGNKLNNDIENLEERHSKLHGMEHGRGRK